MGWTTSWLWQSRRDVIKELTENSIWYPNDGRVQRRHTCLAHCVRGGTLWSVWEVINIDLQTSDFKVRRFIGCDLIRNYGKEEGYGYKDMCESMGPCYYDCPLKYLDMVPEVANEEWRQAVRDHWARYNLKLTVGMIVGLSGCTFPAVKITEVGRKIRCSDRQGFWYTLKRHQLSGQVFETWPEVA